MSDTPETLAAILAKYRKDIAGGQFFTPTQEYILRLLDRIEAAAERERVEREFAHKKVEEALSDEISIRDEKIKQSAPGNASAMREAMHQLSENLLNRIAGICPNLTDEGMLLLAEKALAAPARNCDRFDEYHDAVDAWHREERCLGHHEDGGTCAKDPLASTLAPVCFARWLFAKAEGGAE